MMENLKKVLMQRDGLTENEADEQIANAKENLLERLGNGEMPFDFCEEEFGLEPDYLVDLIF
jgi:hypothetical protein